ncbi:hypothetical protein SPRG_09836 [Saprolegnia parasitica CBS 223.65]|uniref:Uncharacterized protein n=1 Tax=Saprolegnia parasitica (strain CBS 223.65) TaxID=695850 RepID=A0A067CD16_SAPPC|nr:hypothetical protein SPRG_09836 [Saprolegnia parasitica CBS 223.65]KDO24446.1 hypothetical protein SPRG_09836 [Saprolegnia parasitica CBS 223.65]|eukprot:XP_012204876.1 hypothetical protein SPRG_09836 [Saprolegnia parasitica CBS 223.65]
MSRVPFLFAALAIAVSAIAPVPTTPHFPCYECATNGSCAHASWTGDAGKYCGTFSSKTTLVPQWCCCAVAQACPAAGRDTLCACDGPTPAPTKPPADLTVWIYLGFLLMPGVIFILYTLCRHCFGTADETWIEQQYARIEAHQTAEEEPDTSRAEAEACASAARAEANREYKARRIAQEKEARRLAREEEARQREFDQIPQAIFVSTIPTSAKDASL